MRVMIIHLGRHLRLDLIRDPHQASYTCRPLWDRIRVPIPRLLWPIRLKPGERPLAAIGVLVMQARCRPDGQCRPYRLSPVQFLLETSFVPSGSDLNCIGGSHPRPQSPVHGHSSWQSISPTAHHLSYPNQSPSAQPRNVHAQQPSRAYGNERLTFEAASPQVPLSRSGGASENILRSPMHPVSPNFNQVTCLIYVCIDSLMITAS
jgi:hypothetical protein